MIVCKEGVTMEQAINSKKLQVPGLKIVRTLA